MRRLKIVLVDTSNIPIEFFTDGEVVVDTNEVSGFGFNKQVNELNDLNKLRIDGASGSALPATKKNRVIFSKFLSINNRCLDFEPLAVNVFIDGLPREEDWMQFIGFNDSAKNPTIEVELVNSKQHWINALEDKTLADVNYDAYGGIDFTWENVTTNWIDSKWLNNTFMGYAGLINYGQKRSREIFNGETSLFPNCIYLNDFRFLITVYGAIRQMFCQIGWEFKSSILESDFGRSLWMYILKEDYYKTEIPNARGKMLNFRAEFVPTPETMFQNNIYNDDSNNGNFDEGGVFQPSVIGVDLHARWTNPLPFAHRMKFGYYNKLQNDHVAPVIPTMSLFMINGGIVYNTHQQEHDEVPASGGIAEIKGEFEVIVNPGDSVEFRVAGNGATLKTFGGAFIYGTVNGKMYYRGDFVSLSDAVYPYEFLKFFKGVVHGVNGKLKTDWSTKTVYLFPEETVKLADGAEVEGFLKPTVGEVDISDDVVPFSLKQGKPLAVKNRFYKLKFQDSTDPYVDKKLGAKETLHSKVVDLGNKYTGEVKDENPFFEPTPEAPLHTVGTNPVFYPPIDVPIMTDNYDENEEDKRSISYKFGPRIFVAIGRVAQQYYDPITGSPYYAELQWQFEDDADQSSTQFRSTFPYVTQLSGHNINETDDQVNQNFVYGERWFDLYSMFHQKQILDTFNIPPIEVLVKINTAYFQNEDFRVRKYMQYDGQPFNLIPDSISDYRADSELSTPLTFRIDRFVKNNAPCSCQFKACTFFMDLRDSMGDETIANLNIVSFKLDGVEYVTDQVPLGSEVMTESISGIDYVTNLRDALNSIGVPWFRAIAAVNPSGNTQPIGRKGKFIRFEWPGCQTFEIIIYDYGTPGEVYRYNQYGFWAKNDAGLWSRLPEDFPYFDFRNYNCTIVNKSENLCQ